MNNDNTTPNEDGIDKLQEWESYFIETIARYTNAPRIPELAAILARYTVAHVAAECQRARIAELEWMKNLSTHVYNAQDEFTEYRIAGKHVEYRLKELKSALSAPAEEEK